MVRSDGRCSARRGRRPTRSSRPRRQQRGGDGAHPVPLDHRTAHDAAGRPRSLPLPLLRLGVRPRAVRQSDLHDRLRASPQPRRPARLRGRVRRGASTGHPARARAAGGNRRRQPLRRIARRDSLSGAQVRLGLRENAAQFTLLVAVNAFVGAMVGLERSTLPLIGRQDFDVGSSAAVLSFIVAFGLAKAFTNLGAGALAERLGRKRLLVIGWGFALPVPLLVAVAPSWGWIVAANLLLGINQGLA